MARKWWRVAIDAVGEGASWTEAADRADVTVQTILTELRDAEFSQLCTQARHLYIDQQIADVNGLLEKTRDGISADLEFIETIEDPGPRTMARKRIIDALVSERTALVKLQEAPTDHPVSAIDDQPVQAKSTKAKGKDGDAEEDEEFVQIEMETRLSAREDALEKLAAFTAQRDGKMKGDRYEQYESMNERD